MTNREIAQRNLSAAYREVCNAGNALLLIGTPSKKTSDAHKAVCVAIKAIAKAQAALPRTA